ncbi:type III pantothenate kinase [Lentisphaera profundi]|uniref:Type III pantothenate kinase n=1 Tax=Lentisphaera profundi TaxID=1658616 RepID=A0ABY7VU99_9BACT|nr:type III pantothenate kinase [Lentisphaera profundi]WDE97791.1 type III pantothenate kinase [Lentisphaera profundi]
MKTLFANIGNTHSELAWDNLVNVDIIKTVDIMKELAYRAHEVDRLVVASVVPKVTGQLCVRFGQKLILLNAELAKSIKFADVDHFSIGADRIANAIAAQKHYSAPVMVVDCGTCVTTELIDKSNQFQGGNILPGRLLQRKILASATGQLPLAPLNSSLAKSPGRHTMEAIQSGVDLGLIGAIEKLITHNSKNFPDMTIVFTGGDAKFFKKHFPDAELAPPHFTLSGLLELAK